jgi:nucleotide-binding universal stress UspA family protein
MFTSIVIPLDLETGADRALPVAQALAARGGIRLELVTVSSPFMPSEVDVCELGRRAERFCGDCTTTVLHDNDVARALVAFAAERPAPLVVMATRARGVIAEHVLGSVTEDVLALSADPVLLVGPHVESEDLAGRATLVVGVDGTSMSAAVLPAVAEWWDTFGGPSPRLVQVLPPDATDHGSGDAGAAAYVRRLATRLRRGAVDAEWEVAHAGQPTDALLEVADRVDGAVLAVSSERWTDADHSHLRSVARSLTRYSRHPVLVVPATRMRVPTSSG